MLFMSMSDEPPLYLLHETVREREWDSTNRKMLLWDVS